MIHGRQWAQAFAIELIDCDMAWTIPQALTNVAQRKRPRADSTTYPMRVMIPGGTAISGPSFWEDIVMKSSLLFVSGLAIAISSIAPARAAPVHANGNPPKVGCSVAGGWNFSRCSNVGNWKSYSECKAAAVKMGWRDLEGWWYCSSVGFKN